MKRRLAALVCFAVTTFGQRADSPLAAAAPNSLVTDAVALDASGSSHSPIRVRCRTLFVSGFLS